MQGPQDGDNPAAYSPDTGSADNPFESDASALQILLVAALLGFLFVYFVL
ncbi:hypothetical protein [Halosimplex halobium]